MTWPTVSKGIFYPGYAKGMNSGPDRPMRDMNNPKGAIGNSGVTNVHIMQGNNKLNEMNMRKPFG